VVLNAPGSVMLTVIADAIAPAVTTTSGSHTPTIDWSVAQIFPFTITANTTFSFVNAIPGETITLVLTQGASAQGTGTFPTGCLFPGGTKTLSTTASYVDTVSVTCITSSLFICTIALAYA
jgi:hypothetical protein